MTTQYQTSDTLPKDAAAQKFAAWIDDSTSQLDFALPRGLGSESIGDTSKIVAHLGVGTHTIGSAIGTKVVSLAGGNYTEAPSALGKDNVVGLRADKEGALYVRPASGIMAFDTTSADIHFSGSCLLHSIYVAFNDANAGNNVIVKDGTGDRFRVVATTASAHYSEHFTTGVHFGTDLRHTSTLGGAAAASITLVYSAY